MRKAYFVIGILLILCVTNANAQQIRDHGSLKGLRAVGIWLEITPTAQEELTKLGLSPSQVSDIVTLKLRKEGIQILEGEQEEKANTWEQGWPHLVIILEYFNREDVKLAFFSVSMDLRQWATLTRSGFKDDEAFYVTTWQSGKASGTGSHTKIYAFGKERISDVTDRFINDYLAANPKTR